MKKFISGIMMAFVLFLATTANALIAVYDMKVVDWNQDGLDDVLVSDYYAGIWVGIASVNNPDTGVDKYSFSWSQLHTNTAKTMHVAQLNKTGPLDLVVDFIGPSSEPLGIWVLEDQTTWTLVNSGTAEGLYFSHGIVTGNFDNSKSRKPNDPSNVDLAIAFDGFGIWIYYDEGWRTGTSTQIHASDIGGNGILTAGRMAGENEEDIIAVFNESCPNGGTFRYLDDKQPWGLYNSSEIFRVRTGDWNGGQEDDVIAQYGGHCQQPHVGLWANYDESGWEELYNQGLVDAIAFVNWDGNPNNGQELVIHDKSYGFETGGWYVRTTKNGGQLTDWTLLDANIGQQNATIAEGFDNTFIRGLGSATYFLIWHRGSDDWEIEILPFS